MAVRPIVVLGNPILRQKAKRVSRIDESIRSLLDDMVETMHAANGIGLAAPQVGVPLRVIVVEYEDTRLQLVNPEIIKVSEETDVAEEGCLSIPHYYGPVRRHSAVVVKGLNRNGKEVRVKADGWVARVLQHEIDHLDGILFIDKLEDPSALHYQPPEEQAEGARRIDRAEQARVSRALQEARA
ncbi:MAG: peptide deformylase [Chloroflexota bacterium]